MVTQHCSAVESCEVAVLVLNESHWSRQAIEGIASRATHYPHWDLWFNPKSLLLPQAWSGRGVIARIHDARIRDSLELCSQPTINVSWHGCHSLRFPKVISDPEACASTAAEFFLRQFPKSIGYVGAPLSYGYSDPMHSVVERRVLADGYALRTYVFANTSTAHAPDFDRQSLARWLISLPKPTSIVTWSSTVAREVILACSKVNLRVPQDVSVLAVEHDPLMSQMSPVSISYVRQRPECVGNLAATELERLMNGGQPANHARTVLPDGVQECESTLGLEHHQEDIFEALRYIDNNAHRALSVQQVANRIAVSRRTLEVRFRTCLQTTPAERIRDARLQAVRSLLQNTHHSLAEIAERLGFTCTASMSRFFKKMAHTTPTQFREDSQLRFTS